MKTVAVILPINNPEILMQADLTPYNTDEVKFVLHYVDTDLKEITSPEEAEKVLLLVIDTAQQQAHNGASAIIVYGFGELGISELEKILDIPVIALGTEAVQQASQKAINKFTIISGSIHHAQFWQPLIEKTMTHHNYVVASTAPEITPAQIRKDPALIEKLITAAEHEIEEHDVDSFTLGCGSFIGASAPLQERLRSKYGKNISVIDPIEVTFNRIKEIIN